MRSALVAAALVLLPAYALAEEIDPEPHPELLLAAQSDIADPKALEIMSTSRSTKLREAIAGNTRAFPGTLARMASDVSPRVRLAVAGNCRTPQDARNTLQRETDQQIAAAARKAAKTCVQWRWRPVTARK